MNRSPEAAFAPQTLEAPVDMGTYYRPQEGATVRATVKHIGKDSFSPIVNLQGDDRLQCIGPANKTDSTNSSSRYEFLPDPHTTQAHRWSGLTILTISEEDLTYLAPEPTPHVRTK